jgi:hypothetical protein
MFSFNKVAALFEGLIPQEHTYEKKTYNGNPTQHHELRVYALDKDNREYLVGWAKYISPGYNNEGSYVPFLGYGEGYRDPMVPMLKKWHPQVGIDLMLWIRRNAPKPIYADLQNEQLGSALHAEVVPGTGIQVVKNV